MVVSSAPPGIPSPARLAGWLSDNIKGEPLELTDVQLIAGGRSNLTYRLTVSGPSGSRLLVLRRPPLGHVLPTAHDMSREFRVLSALAGTQVPVAPLVASCTNEDVIGAPFYVMEHVPGVVLRTRTDTQAPPPDAPGQVPPADPGLVPLTVPEIKRITAALTTRPLPPPLVIHWNAWTRRHQARSRWYHQRARLKRDYALVS